MVHVELQIYYMGTYKYKYSHSLWQSWSWAFLLPLLYYNYYTLSIKKMFSERQFSYIIVCVIAWGHGYASWIRPVAMNVQRKSALQGSGLVRTVGQCAQTRVPRPIATARDALWNDWCESATPFERPVKQALALATELWAKREAMSVLCHTYQ